ncbi:hypothetical protein K9K77_02615 [Candidatus Babeliales bacterium]|nr:hypothetical protein [Candidatus Babeliales bacterium]
MIIFESLKDSLATIQKTDFYKYIAIIGGSILVLLCVIFYYYHITTSDLLKKINSINAKRKDTQLVLKRLKKVEQQSQEVNELLEKEPNFKIKNFFDTAIQQHKLENKLKIAAADISSEIIHKKYTERKLTAQFKQISTQELCEFLQTIEQKARIYTKELIITKTKGASLDVMLTIATLTPQRESKDKTR